MRRRISLVRLLALLAAAGAATLPGEARGQGVTTAAIAGTVRGTDGAPLSGAQVSVRDARTGRTAGGITNSDGRYFVPYLQPGGPYRLSVQSIGFAEAVRDSIFLTLGQTRQVDLALAEQAVALGAIEVTADATSVFRSSRTGPATVITEDALDALPTLTRNFTDIAAVSPYVYNTGSAPSIAGANNRMNNIQIDGAVNNDVFGLADSGVPGGQANAKPISMEAIGQFQVLVAPFDIRQAGFAGGLINAVTKSGTNRFEGTLFGNFQNLDFIREVLVVQQPAGPSTAVDSLRASDFSRGQAGFSLGGPIVRDRVHFFVSGEIEQYDSPTSFGRESSPATLRINPDSLSRFETISQRYGLNLGRATVFSRENPKANLFGRVDFQLNPRHRLTLRHNFANARDDDDVSRGGSRFEYESNTYDFKSTTHSTVLQLHSTLGQSSFNELLFNYERVRDRRAPEAAFRYPQVDVSVTSNLPGATSTVQTTIRAGAEVFSQANELDQDVLQVTNNFTMTRGAHRITVGGQAEWYDFRNLFAPNTIGQYTFRSLADFEANRPSGYNIAVPVEGSALPAAEFGALQVSGYIQDEFTIGSNLTVTAGIRVDVPTMLDEPRNNPNFQRFFNFSTTQVPKANPLVSPRVGFNWQSASGPQTQIRGGIGLFTGRPPFVWVSNAYGNTGRELATIFCGGSGQPAAPPFSANPPRGCATGGTAAPATSIINTVADDFRFPQDLKATLGFDRELPGGLSASIEGLYTKAVYQPFTRELNLGAPTVQTIRGIGTRPIYGTPTSSGFRPNRRTDATIGHVTRMENTSEPYAYLVTGELRRVFTPWSRRLDVRGSYTYNRSYDTQSQTSSQATSNIGFSPIRGQLNEPELTPSNFDRPHKVTISAFLNDLWPRYGGTTIGMFYQGMSGKAYAYVIDGDVNGDGYETAGVVNDRNNDLVYVPNDVSEINWTNADQARLFRELMDQEECLQEARGTILQRNACRAPFWHSMNLKLEQGIPVVGRSRVKFTLDVFNLLNLLNEDWNLERGPSFNQVDLLALNGRQGNTPTGDLQFRYDGFTARGTDGQIHAVRPYSTFFNSSRYQLRAGVRVTF